MTRSAVNICQWPKAEQQKLKIELKTNQLIIGLKQHKITRRQIEKARDDTPDDLKEYFTAQLNKWLDIYKMRRDHDQNRKKAPAYRT